MRFLFLLLALAGCHDRDRDGEWTPTGFIVGSRHVGEFLATPPGNTPPGWTPQRADIDKLEAEIGPLVEPKLKASLSGYARQYLGVVEGGQRVIRVQGYCLRGERTLHDANNPRITHVKDGGACYWDITWDPKTSTFTRFGRHGNA